MRVLVVDDSAFMRRALSMMIDSDPALHVVGSAKDGLDAIEQAKRLKPDLITLDIEMPKMDGLAALRRIMAECPTTVIMVSSLTTRGSHEALRAMRLGAVDFVAKDASYISQKIEALKEELISKIKAIGASNRLRAELAGRSAPQDHIPTTPPKFRRDQFSVIVIGSSTGGPPVVETIVKALPPDLHMPVLVAQHMPAVFTASFAKRLDARSAVSVYEAENQMPLYPGTVYIGRGGLQMRIRPKLAGRWSLEVNDVPADALYKPSVNILFASAAKHVSGRSLGVVLTGMGDDGVEGAHAITDGGGVVLTQSAQTSVVYGMPKAVDDAGLTAASLSPAQISKILASFVQIKGGVAQGDKRFRQAS